MAKDGECEGRGDTESFEGRGAAEAPAVKRKSGGGVQLRSEGGAAAMRHDRPGRASGGWIKKAHLKKGAFTKQAKAAGESVHEYAEEKKSAPGKTGKRARLALTFEGMAKKK